MIIARPHCCISSSAMLITGYILLHGSLVSKTVISEVCFVAASMQSFATTNPGLAMSRWSRRYIPLPSPLSAPRQKSPKPTMLGLVRRLTTLGERRLVLTL